MKLSKKPAIFSLVIALPVLLIFSSVFLVTSKAFYSLERGSASKSAYGIIDYIKGSGELNVSMTKPEADHLGDVRSLVSVLKIILLVSFLVSLASVALLLRSSKALAARYLFLAGMLSLGFCVFLFLLLLFFGFTFELFHRIFFAQGSYLFDENSVLIGNFPLDYFYHSFEAIILICSLLSALLIGVCWLYRREK